MTSSFLDCINHKPISHIPVWLMRQAGRYLPEYREVRKLAGNFLNLCKNPDLATKVTLQPLKRFDLDVAILFSDILVIPEAMGIPLSFIENEGPKFSHKISNSQDIDNLDITDIEHKLDYVFKTIKNCKGELKNGVPLIGFSGSPFTLACYMLEGGSSKNYLEVRRFLYARPDLMHKLLAKLTKAIIEYLTLQIKSGVDVVMLFDSWGGILTDKTYVEFSLSYLEQIIKSLPTCTKQVPSMVFTKGGGVWLDKISTIGADVIGIDWTIDIGMARQIVPPQIVLQGNLDPHLLAFSDKDTLKIEVLRILEGYRKSNHANSSGLVFNLGHGILPVTNPDHVAYLVDLVHEFGVG